MSNTTIPYEGRRGCFNCTVLPAEMQRDRATNKKALEAHVAANQEYKRVKKGKRVLKHSVTEDQYEDGLEKKVKVETATSRKNN